MWSHIAAGVALGFVIGLSLGMLGGGGSILIVPIFTYVLGFSAKESIAMSLVVVGVTSLFGALNHWRQRHVDVRIAVIFGGVGMVGTSLGAWVAMRLDGAEQLTIFATVMLVAALFMFRASRTPTAASTGRHSLPAALMAMHALVVSTLTGLVGVGGGFLIVPALVWDELPMPTAVGTSLLVIAMNCASGFYRHLGQAHIAWSAVALVTAGTLPGIATGTYAMRFVRQEVLRRAFAMLLVTVAVYMLYQNLRA